MIYLATPYTHNSLEIRRYRYKVAAQVAARLILEGNMIFCPMTHSHDINEVLMRTNQGGGVIGFHFWREFDTYMLDVCSQMWIVKMEGWSESFGIQSEVNYMISKGRGQQIKYISPTDEDLKVD